MIRNVGNTEKTVRLTLGGLLVLSAFLLELPAWGTVMLSVVGIVALLTGSVGYCPAWTLFGINTCSLKRKA